MVLQSGSQSLIRAILHSPRPNHQNHLLKQIAKTPSIPSPPPAKEEGASNHEHETSFWAAAILSRVLSDHADSSDNISVSRHDLSLTMIRTSKAKNSEKSTIPQQRLTTAVILLSRPTLIRPFPAVAMPLLSLEDRQIPNARGNDPGVVGRYRRRKNTAPASKSCTWQ